MTIRAIEYDAGPVGFFCSISDVTDTGIKVNN